MRKEGVRLQMHYRVFLGQNGGGGGVQKSENEYCVIMVQ